MCLYKLPYISLYVYVFIHEKNININHPSKGPKMTTPRKTRNKTPAPPAPPAPGPSGNGADMRAPGSLTGCFAKFDQSVIEEQIRGAAAPVDEGAEMEGVEEGMFDGLGLEDHLGRSGKTKKRGRGPSPGSSPGGAPGIPAQRRRLDIGTYPIPTEMRPLAEHKLLGNFIGAYLLSLPTGLPVGAIKRVYESADGSTLFTSWDQSGSGAPQPPPVDHREGPKRAKAAECQTAGTKTVEVQSRLGQGPKSVVIQASWLERFEKCRADPARLLKGVLTALGQYNEFKKSWNLKTAKFID